MDTGLESATELQFVGAFLGRLGVAFVCGAIIGLERESSRKPAGLRTNVLICMGACLFTMVSVFSAKQIGGPAIDPGRIAAQIVSGIGFLGAGAILRSGFNIQGLTTAATIWFIAAVGMVVGFGLLILGLAAAVSALLVLIGLNGVEEWVQRKFPPPEQKDREKPGPGVAP